ncbi:hypothetical protein D3C85_1675310 [compost metagenome]
MSLSTSNLAAHINTAMTARLSVNLKLEFTKDIVLEFTRTELRGLTKGDRIKDVSITKMINELRDMGYVVKGKPGGENFRVTFDVETYLSQADTLEELQNGTEYLLSVINDEE